MEIGIRIKRARGEKALTQEALADLLGVTKSAVSQWESGNTAPSVDNLRQISAILGVSLDALIAGGPGERQPPLRYATSLHEGPQPRGRVPLISWVQAGDFTTEVDNFQPGDAEEWVETTVPIHRHTYALRVNGDSMTNPAGEPSFPHGSVIIIEPDAIDSVEKMVNRFVIVKRDDNGGEATFKQLVRDGGRYFLKPLNPQYPMLELGEGDVFCGVVRERVTRFF
jgi:SOS-response transcriptional repressor LexA